MSATCATAPALGAVLYVSGPYRVWVLRAVLAKAQRLARVRAPLETGGLLLGQVVDGEAHVLALTGPGRRARRSRLGYEADRARDNRLVARVHPRLHYLGDWHTHPGGPAVLSATDVDSIRGALTTARPEVLHLLLAGPANMTSSVASVFTVVGGESSVRRMTPEVAT
ncbi:Mov34/MPN/PAD-1 family protein [Myxococcus sp. AS-1-15]|uniref:Mov34/MPN/PAD-1 family protein n=1 Tax=Myxococcus sp. AS-1-15 TaxID=2874600 RepID=UPI001CBF2818|nr:Mov34/MPN/PAD-1 family protein [Myxococcus sp. AS-1-15]MBZ4402493.1 Mov34/MPN/PAD-1 family protein [Myxococcus sp. AS-1-15]